MSKGYNRFSVILYNFMYANNFIAADRSFQQPLSYTYFCDKRGTSSWLDHVLCSQHDLNTIVECGIINRHADNESDHQPISTTFKV